MSAENKYPGLPRELDRRRVLTEREISEMRDLRNKERQAETKVDSKQMLIAPTPSPNAAKPNVVCQGGEVKRLFIESDVLKEDEFRTAQRRVALVLEETGKSFTKNVFDEKVDFAWHKPSEAWEAVKRADEIYGNTSLVPLCGYGSYTGSPVVMDVMMKKAIEENITGKSVIFLPASSLSDLW